jgi:hypothetical protein
MTEWKALDLVVRYSHHTRTIKALGQEIGEHLERCKGLDGKRLEVDKFGCHIHQRDTDNKNRDKSTHLWGWYQPETAGDDSYYGESRLVWHQVGTLEAEECPHCYAAHLAIQERKEHRKKLGAVKAAMTRGGAA